MAGGVIPLLSPAVRQRLIIAIGEIVLKLAARGRPQVLCAGLQDTIEYASDRSKPGASYIDAFEHLVQQRGFASGPCRVKRVLQAVV